MFSVDKQTGQHSTLDAVPLSVSAASLTDPRQDLSDLVYIRGIMDQRNIFLRTEVIFDHARKDRLHHIVETVYIIEDAGIIVDP